MKSLSIFFAVLLVLYTVPCISASKDIDLDFDNDEEIETTEAAKKTESVEETDEFDDPELLKSATKKETKSKPKPQPKKNITPPEEGEEITRMQVLMAHHYEIFMISFIIVYIINAVIGKSKNKKIALNWYEKNIKFFEENYAHLGAEREYNPKANQLINDSYNQYKFFASGRVFVNWMIVNIETKKRQDLLSILSSMFLFSEKDKIMYEATLTPSNEIPVVFSICKKKDTKVMTKTYSEIEEFCESFAPNYLDSKNVLLTENEEFVSKLFLDKSLLKSYKKVEPYLDLIFCTDRKGVGNQQSAILISFDITNKSLEPDTLNEMTIFTHTLIDILCSSSVKGNYRKEAENRRKEYDAKKSRELAEKNAEEVKNEKEERKANKPTKVLTREQLQKQEEKEKKEQLKNQRKRMFKIVKN